MAFVIYLSQPRQPFFCRVGGETVVRVSTYSSHTATANLSPDLQIKYCIRQNGFCLLRAQVLRREKEFCPFHLRLIFVLVFAGLLCQFEDHQEASQITERERVGQMQRLLA